MDNVTKKPLYKTIDGILHAALFCPKSFREAMSYKPVPEDVFIVTYPKCGTTWMQNIALYIFRKGRPLENNIDFFTMCPFIDMTGDQSIASMPRPGALKTHLPYTHMPYSPEAKYIFVARNPKDCCVSLYHHTRMIPGYAYWDGNFDDFFELFMAGQVEYNDYFDHLMSWYPHRNDSQVFYTTYEDMKKDTRGIVVQLANFLGQEYVDAIEKDNAVLNNILHYSSFDYMKKHISEIFVAFSAHEYDENSSGLSDGIKHAINFTRSLNRPKETPPLNFVRKGVVGDWKNHFTGEQAARLNAKFQERTAGTEIQQWYSSLV